MEEEFASLVEEIEGHLQRYLERSQQEYPAGSQADGVAAAVVQRVLASGDGASFQSLVKLCVFLVENLEDVSKTYEDFYSEELKSLKEDNAALRARLLAVDEENSCLRSQLHQRAEELKVREMAIRSLRVATSSKGSLSSSFASRRPQSPTTDLQAAVSEKMKEVESLQRRLHAEQMRSREFDEKVSLDGDDDEEEAEAEAEEEKEKEASATAAEADEAPADDEGDDELELLSSSGASAEKLGIFNRELVKENTELQSRLLELLQENAQYRELSAQLTADNSSLKTATKELRNCVERLHRKLHADDLLSAQASDIFEQLVQENDRLCRLSQSHDCKAAADALAADETFDIDGDEEEIPDDEEEEARRQCRHCAKLRDSLRRLELRHDEEAGRIRDIVTQNVCMKAELEDWKADMAEKVRQNVQLNSQLENLQRLLNRLSPTKTPRARSVFGNTLIRK